MNRSWFTAACLAGSLAGLPVASHAESRPVSASAPAAAQVLSPLRVTPLTLLSFGLVTSSARAGTVTVSPLGGVRTTEGAHVALGFLAGPATFFVHGERGWSYGVTLPGQLRARPILANRHAADLVVRDFTVRSLNGDAGSGRLDDRGLDLLRVGATLQVPPRTAPGVYAVSVPVSVDYN